MLTARAEVFMASVTDPEATTREPVASAGC
jgi:hypothetical protein